MCVYVILNMNISINTVGTSTKELKRKLELAMKKLPSRLQLHILKDPSLISNEFKSQARMLYNAAKNETTTHLRSSRSSKNTSIITYSYHFQPYLNLIIKKKQPFSLWEFFIRSFRRNETPNRAARSTKGQL